MINDNVKKFLEYVKNNPEAKEKLKAFEKPEAEKEFFHQYIEAAKQMGFDITEEEFREYIRSQCADHTARTEAAAAKIQALEDDELDPVAGGSGRDLCDSVLWLHASCQNTYEMFENCSSQDGCDGSFNKYGDYWCLDNDYGLHCGRGVVSWLDIECWSEIYM